VVIAAAGLAASHTTLCASMQAWQQQLAGHSWPQQSRKALIVMIACPIAQQSPRIIVGAADVG
jgi:hypothetical protein